MIQFGIAGCGQLQRPEADIVESLVVDTERFIGVLDELVHRKGGVVWLDHSIRNLFGKLTIQIFLFIPGSVVFGHKKFF